MKAVLLDIGSTVIHNFWNSRTKAIKKETGISIENRPEIKNKIMTGKLSLKELLKLSYHNSNSTITFDEFLRSYEKNYEKYAPINKNMLKLIKRLKKYYKIYAFSNTNDIHEKINRRRSVFRDFDRIFLSNKIGIKKPSRKAFAFVKTKIKTPYKSIIFVDDDIDNVKMATNLGMVAIKYKDYQILIKQLKKIGVKIR